MPRFSPNGPAAAPSARLTKRETGTQLFISAAIVEYHLRAVFRRLGVMWRGQLRDALADSLVMVGRLKTAGPGTHSRPWTRAFGECGLSR